MLHPQTQHLIVGDEFAPDRTGAAIDALTNYAPARAPAIVTAAAAASRESESFAPGFDGPHPLETTVPKLRRGRARCGNPQS